MNKLLFFASDYRIGQSALLTDQVLALQESNVPLTVITGEGEQESGLRDLLKENKVDYHIIRGLDVHSDFKRLVKDIRKIILVHKISIVHVQNNWQLALISYIKYVSRCGSVRIVYTLHGFRHNHPFKAIIAKMIIGGALWLFADRIICMSTYLKHEFFFISYKILLLPLGIPQNFFLTKSEYNLPLSDGLQMVFPAQFRYGKNQNLIIRAFNHHLKQTGDRFSHLYLPGDGELLSENKALVRKMGIEDRVSFPGLCSKEEVRNLYLQCNIGIVGSNSETFGQSIVETVVLGRCLLSTHVGIADDILINGRNGFFFSSEEELVKIFSLLLAHPEKIKGTGEYNFNQKSIFKWSEINKKYISLLNIMKNDF